MRKFAFTGFGLAVLGSAATAIAPAPLNAGRWKERIEMTKMTLGDDILPFEAGENRVQVTYRCLAKSDAGSASAFLESQMPRDRCSGVVGGAKSGKIAMTGNCNVGHGPGKVAIDGTYGGASYKANVSNEMPMEGKKLVMHSTVAGSFEGPCRGDERE